MCAVSSSLCWPIEARCCSQCLCVCGSFNNPVTERDSTATCTRMSSGQWIAKCVDGSGRGLIGLNVPEFAWRKTRIELSYYIFRDEFRCITYILDSPVRNCGSG
jgi:hypothetical protein